MINLRCHAGGKYRLTVARCQTIRSLFVVDGDGELGVRQSFRRTGQYDGQSAHDDTNNNLSFRHECSRELSLIGVESNTALVLICPIEVTGGLSSSRYRSRGRPVLRQMGNL